MKQSIISVVLPSLIISHSLALPGHTSTELIAPNYEQWFESIRNKETSYFKCSYNGEKKMGVKKIGNAGLFKLVWVDGVSQIYTAVGGGGMTTSNYYNIVDKLGGRWNWKRVNKDKGSFSLTNINNNNTINCSSF